MLCHSRLDPMSYHVVAFTMAQVRQGALEFQRQLSAVLRESRDLKVYSASPFDLEERRRVSRYDLWQWGVSAMVAGSRHHPLYAHARQCSEKEQSRLWPRAIYLSAREQSLPLSCGRATELRWLERSQSCPCLYRQRETLRSMLTKSALHEWTI